MPITTDAILDTNILLRLPYDTKSNLTEAARAYIRLVERGFTVGTTVANFAEFASNATRPVSVDGLGLSPAQAQTRITQLEQFLTVCSESIESYRIWKDLLRKYEVRGRQVHDARIVAIMLQSGIKTILTLNDKDFRRYPEIITVHPDDVLSAL